MHIAAFETVTPSIAEAVLPCRLEQTSSRLRPLLVLALLVPVAMTVLAPLLLIAHHVAAAPQGMAMVVERPISSLQIGLGFVFAAALVGWPLSRVIARLNRVRSVVIDRDGVHVADRGVLGEHQWSAALSDYAGIAHHVRTTHSVTRHELMLVHHDPRRHVLLMVADRISKAEVEAVAARLGVAEVSPRLLYGAMLGSPSTGNHQRAPRPAPMIAGDALHPVEV
jgi:hypothetical protein